MNKLRLSNVYTALKRAGEGAIATPSPIPSDRLYKSHVGKMGFNPMQRCKYTPTVWVRVQIPRYTRSRGYPLSFRMIYESVSGNRLCREDDHPGYRMDPNRYPLSGVSQAGRANPHQTAWRNTQIYHTTSKSKQS